MRAQVRTEIIAALEALRTDGWTLPATIDVPLERPKRPEHGDLATNIAMTLVKSTGRKPREIADALVAKLASTMNDATSAIRSAEIAGPGFLNLRVRDNALQRVIASVLDEGSQFGESHEKHRGRVLVEFVSANPTGPLHIAHARGAIVGDALVRLMRAAGHSVDTEYYVNDAGQKVINLAWTLRAVVHGQELWSEAYRGPYFARLVDELGLTQSNVRPLDFDGDGEARKPRLDPGDRALAAAAVEKLLQWIRNTLDRLGLHFDHYFGEQSLVDSGRVRGLVDEWVAKKIAEERDGAVFFKASGESEDDKDRVLRKSNGDYTYFATDIEYHRLKLSRGYTHLIDVWGADHHGYIARMRDALEALGLDKTAFEILLMQMVSLVENGKPFKMSKTAGTYVAIDDVLDEIDASAGHAGAGRDALRYFLLMRSSNSPMEIDVDLAKKQSVDNPVFYAQYSHARMCQMLERARSAPEFAEPRRLGLLSVPEQFDAALAARLTLPEEREILSACDLYPYIVHEAAEQRAPHRVVFFVQELAQSFASYYTSLQRIHGDAVLPQRAERERSDWIARWDWEKTRARLLWLVSLRRVYANALALVGVDAPERMTRLADVEDGSVPDGV